jgi:DNA-binding transcriptional LysR family regulator
MLDRIVHGPDRRPTAGTVSLIAPPTLAHRFLHGMIAQFVRDHPQTRIHIEVAPSGDVVSQVADGRADIGLTDSQLQHPSVALEPFRRSTGHVLMPRGHVLAQREGPLGAEELANHAFIALTRRFSVRAHLDSIFAGIGREPKIVAEVATAALACELVRAGVGVSILNPFPLALRSDQDVVYRPFEPSITYESSFVLSNALPPSATARRFIDFVRRRQPEDGYSEPIR